MGIQRILVLAALLLPTIAFGATPSTSESVEVISDFSGGLNTAMEPTKVPKTMTPYCRNVFGDEKIGSLTTIGGLSGVGSTTTLGGIRFGFVFNKENGDKEYIVSDSSIVLTTNDFRSCTFIRGALNGTVNLSATQARNKVWFTNGADNVFTWDGSSMVILNGLNFKPNVPKCRYIAFHQEKVFLFNEASNNSALYWSALTVSTSGTVITPDDALAWPSANSINIGQGDGQAGTFIKVFRGNLTAGKERSLYEVLGKDPYVPLKKSADVGFISADSVVEFDNKLYGQALDGWYSFDGDNVELVTELIEPDLENVRVDSTRVIQNLWDTQADFNRGQFSGTTATVTGLIEMHTDQTITTLTVTNNYISQASDGVGRRYSKKINAMVPALPSPLVYTLKEVSFHGCKGSNLIAGTHFTVHVLNLRTGTTHTVALSAQDATCNADPPPNIGDTAYRLTAFNNTTFSFTSDDINLSSVMVSIDLTAAGAGASPQNDVFAMSTSAVFPEFKIVMAPPATAQFISDVATISMITVWSQFDSGYSLNGGDVDFFYRAATSPVNIATYPFINIAPGTNIGAAVTNNYIQWAATVTAITTVTRPTIDFVTIDHIEGSGSNTRSFAVKWNNRWWLAVSTENTGNFPLIYVKSNMTNPNPNAWWPIEGINVRMFMKDGDTFYAGSATAPIIYRLDFGTNFDGRPIIPTYELPALEFSHPDYPGLAGWYKKKLTELLIDVDKQSNATLKVGIAVDDGDFTDTSISINGTSGRTVRTIKGISTMGKSIRFRLRVADLDKSLSFHKLGIFYLPMNVRDE